MNVPSDEIFFGNWLRAVRMWVWLQMKCDPRQELPILIWIIETDSPRSTFAVRPIFWPLPAIQRNCRFAARTVNGSNKEETR
jgi:hypothetical protein